MTGFALKLQLFNPERKNITMKQDDKKNWYRSRYDAFQKSLNGHVAAPAREIHKLGLAHFNEYDFPTTKHEDWKYTSVEPILQHQFEPELVYPKDKLSQKTFSSLPLNDLSTHRIVWINGHFSPEFSSLTQLPKGLTIKSLAAAAIENSGLVFQHLTQYAGVEKNIFTALNSAFLMDGAFVSIAENAIIEKPVHLMFIAVSGNQPALIQPWNLIVAGKHSQATIVESYVAAGQETYFTNAVTEIFTDENAVLDHHKIQLESPNAFHIGNMHIHQQRSSNFTSNLFSFGAALARNEAATELDGEGIESRLNGVYVVRDHQHVDNRTFIDHAKPHCHSFEVYKGILADQSTAVFNGKILVRQDAQKTDAKQSNHALLLSKDATINTKPQLEIFADDVKCTHGATVGQIDAEMLFYLRARGLGKQEAENLLTQAFAGSVVEQVRYEPLREELNKILLERLKK
ncbi:Fe-S cluster assembly protein SufD [bacterium]|nr:Fe-S cluster assembly protein SufD [bacterium]